MPYSSDRPLPGLFDPEPAARAARRMADRAVQQLHDDARAATPVAKPLPGHDEALWVQRRGRRPGKAREAWKRSSIDRSVSPAGQPRFEGEAFNDDPLIELIEYPTRPHVIRPRLDRIIDHEPELGAITKEALEGPCILRGGDDEDFPNTRLNERGERVINHRLVVDGQQLLGDGQRGRMQPRAGAAGQDDALPLGGTSLGHAESSSITGFRLSRQSGRGPSS